MRHLEWFLEKMVESRPQLFYYFLHFFPKTTLSASKWQKDPAGQWRAYIPNLKEIVILRHLEWFFEKSEESRLPQNLPF